MKLPFRDTGRLEAFSDGVFAISATLLVVTLEVPSSFEQLLASLYGFIAFAFSFTMLILIWSAHYKFFRRFPLEDNWTIALNALLLFLVLLYVYPLKFLSVAMIWAMFGSTATYLPSISLRGMDDLRLLFIIYGIGFSMVFVSLALFYLRARLLSDKLNLSRPDRFHVDTEMGQYLVYSAIGLLSVGIAVTGIGMRLGLPGWVYFLIGPAMYLFHFIRDRQKKALGLVETAEEE
ncbi:DUF1211 domain-containing protein [bacterium]|nr:DUF1211 domain-containing protein [bacterium]